MLEASVCAEATGSPKGGQVIDKILHTFDKSGSRCRFNRSLKDFLHLSQWDNALVT